eukprot:scaffold1347_cov350-Pavlova_lutheri.AAC.25
MEATVRREKVPGFRRCQAGCVGLGGHTGSMCPPYPTPATLDNSSHEQAMSQSLEVFPRGS